MNFRNGARNISSMDKLNGLMAFVKTADLGSFVAAGKALDISASAVGKAVAKLEQQLGVRLLQRSTRRIQLTEEGRLFHERCRGILDDLDDAQAMVSRSADVPRGRLRVSAPIVSYHFLMPLVPAFLARHPEVELDIDFNDQVVDLIEDGIDLAIRSGEMPDSRLVSRPLQAYRFVLCTSPDYARRHGLPRDVGELADHAAICFRHTTSSRLQEWPVQRPPGQPEPRLRAVLTCTNMEAVRAAAIEGIGLACVPDFLVQGALADGRLLSVLDHCMDAGGRFHAIWPSSRHLSPKVRVFVDHLRAGLALPP
jgi:DNA-binding transcriptional LysR family regulator